MRLARIFRVMPIEVFLMGLGTAFVHATWNALVKADGDRFRADQVVAIATTLAGTLALKRGR